MIIRIILVVAALLLIAATCALFLVIGLTDPLL
jgi:hypothetical protein